MNLPIFKAFSGAITAFVAFLSPLSAADLAPLPPRPANLLADDAKVFSPDQISTLATTLATLSEGGDVTLFLVTKYYLPEEETTPTALRYLDAWAPDSPGLIVLYSRGNDRISISVNDSLEQTFTRPEIKAFIGEAVGKGKSNPDQDPAARLTASISFLADSLSARLDARKQNADSARRALAPLALGVGIACLLLSALTWGVSCAISQKRRRKNDFIFFPSVLVAQRFGAPFGGGVSAQIGSSSKPGQPAANPDSASSLPIPRRTVPVSQCPRQQNPVGV